ncbi:MAG: DNA polymerase III subunit delta [Rhodospirillales bacterium]|nr:MAG: DNA polymerase III subunit delta [Rhodospirillales bacterium]
MKLAPARIEAFLTRPDAAVAAVLVFGPDYGLVRERADRLMAAVVPADDPFCRAELTGPMLRADPARLADEAAALGLSGGGRVVRVRDATDAAASIFADWLGRAPSGALVIAEAGDLAKRSTLRKAFEEAGNAAAIACYADDPAAVAATVREVLSSHDLAIEGEALEFLCARLGNDHGVTRRELEKLAVFKGGPGKVNLDDAMAVVGDAAQVSLNAVIDAACLGDVAALETALQRLVAEGSVAPATVVRAVGRHLLRLLQAQGLIAAGTAPERALMSLRPPVFRGEQPRFRRQLALWPIARIGPALALTTGAEIQCKSTGVPAEAVCGRLLMRLASAAGAAGRPHS